MNKIYCLFSRLLTLVLLLSLTGCAGSFFSQKALTPVDSLYLVHQVQHHADQMRSMKGSGTVKVFSTAGSFGGTFECIVKQPDSLWMKIEGPLGIDLAKMQLVKDSVSAYSPFENILYFGSVASLRNSPTFPFPVDVEQLLNSITGLLVPESSAVQSGQPAHIQGNKYLIQNQEDRITIESRGPVVENWIKKDNLGDPIWEWQGENFRKNKGIRLPQTVRLTTYQPEQKMILVYNRIKINDPLKTGWADLKVPQSAIPLHF